MPGRMLTLACKREKWGECDRLSPSIRMFHYQNNTTMKSILLALYVRLAEPEYNRHSMRGKVIKTLENILGIQWEDVKL